MSYILHAEPHPLGVVVRNSDGERELLIEGETCCGLSFEELKRIANSCRQLEINDEMTDKCRLKQA